MTERVPHISPELVLIDPELAEIARAALPDPSDILGTRPEVEREPLPPVRSFFEALPAEPARLPDDEAEPPSRRRRTGRRLLIAACVSVLVGFSIGRMTASHPDFTFEAVPQDAASGSSVAYAQQGNRAAAPLRSGRAADRTTGLARRDARAARSVVAGTRYRGKTKPAPKRRARALGRTKPKRTPRPSRNVLGVVVSLSPHGVTLQWQPPTSSRRVVVLRRNHRSSKHAGVVYRGTQRSFRDRSVRAGTYTYLIVNYDRGRSASSGVPTVVDVPRRRA